MASRRWEFSGKIHEDAQGLLGGGGVQALAHQSLDSLLSRPLHHIHNVLEVVVKRLTGDPTDLHQVLHGDLVCILPANELQQCIRHSGLHIQRHGLSSLSDPVFYHTGNPPPLASPLATKFHQ